MQTNTITNNHNQLIHCDSRIWLHEADRTRYGGARLIDAKTFITNHPDSRLQEGFTIGTYHYDLQ
jgi:hypothetical protein